MGKPVINGADHFEKVAINDITVWRSHSICPAATDQPIAIDLDRWLFFGKRIVVKNAR